jgi:hypothetical protein
MGLLKLPLKLAILLGAVLLLPGCVVDPYDGYYYPYGYAPYGYAYPAVGVYGGYGYGYGYYGHPGYYGHGYYGHWR